VTLSSCAGAHHLLHPFPTRRSSDLFLRHASGSRQVEVRINDVCIRETEAVRILPGLDVFVVQIQRNALARLPANARLAVALAGRSEEHTSELQSRENLVCRLLLEKK